MAIFRWHMIRRFLATGLFINRPFRRTGWNERFLASEETCFQWPITASIWMFMLPAVSAQWMFTAAGGGRQPGRRLRKWAGECGDARVRAAARGWPMEVQIVGEVAPALQANGRCAAQVPLRWVGLVKRKEIPGADARRAHCSLGRYSPCLPEIGYRSAGLAAACRLVLIPGSACRAGHARLRIHCSLRQQLLEVGTARCGGSRHRGGIVLKIVQIQRGGARAGRWRLFGAESNG